MYTLGGNRECSKDLGPCSPRESLGGAGQPHLGGHMGREQQAGDLCLSDSKKMQICKMKTKNRQLERFMGRFMVFKGRTHGERGTGRTQ